MTARYALIGDPVAHSLSPAMQGAAFARTGIDAAYEALRVVPSDLANAMKRLRSGYEGFNVTTPLKEAVVPFLDELTEVAAAAEAVNTVRVRGGRMSGHNTDGTGFVAAAAELWSFLPAAKHVCILGSGPAARAIALALRSSGAASIDCWSRNTATAAAIGAAPSSRPELLICALPPDAAIPEALLQLFSGVPLVFDVNYGTARSAVPAGIGAKRSDGLPLLLHQGAQAFSFWTGRDAPLDSMRASLR